MDFQIITHKKLQVNKCEKSLTFLPISWEFWFFGMCKAFSSLSNGTKNMWKWSSLND